MNSIGAERDRTVQGSVALEPSVVDGWGKESYFPFFFGAGEGAGAGAGAGLAAFFGILQAIRFLLRQSIYHNPQRIRKRDLFVISGPTSRDDDVRTTLELDDDLLAAAKHLASQRGSTLGQVISALARQSLAATTPEKVRNGALLFVPKSHTSKPDIYSSKLTTAVEDFDDAFLYL